MILFKAGDIIEEYEQETFNKDQKYINMKIEKFTVEFLDGHLDNFINQVQMLSTP